MRSKKQQTMAKMARERLVKERRALKQEKKQAAAAARNAAAAADDRAAEAAEDESGRVDAARDPAEPARGSEESPDPATT